MALFNQRFCYVGEGGAAVVNRLAKSMPRSCVGCQAEGVGPLPAPLALREPGEYPGDLVFLDLLTVDKRGGVIWAQDDFSKRAWGCVVVSARSATTDDVKKFLREQVMAPPRFKSLVHRQ